MKQIFIQGGGVEVQEVPAPLVSPKNVLVRVAHSCISVGTEMAGVKMSGLPLYKRALKQPDNVKKVMDMVRDQGLKRTVDRVRGKLSGGSATGYSAAGVVMEVGSEVDGFRVGDRVACAGAGIANHAEIIDVPVNLTVKIPEEVSTAFASTVALGSIAMQGVRRTETTLGETIVVVGLGILGQMTTQMLSASGCRVIGVDLDPKRIQLALDNGMDWGINPKEENYIERVNHLTDGFGGDAVIITAAGSSSEIISEAMQATRKKGRVILVGDVGLDLKRGDMYQKELDFLISTSYGPGRYDPYYEQEGLDYPLPYIRWTEGRNMESYLSLLATGKITLENMGNDPFPVDQAPKAYDSLKGEGEKPLLVVLAYPERAEAAARKIAMPGFTLASNKIRTALVGAGSFAQGMHLPNMVKLRSDFQLKSVMSRTGSNARAVAKQYQAEYVTTEYEEILNDKEVDLVLIATRHNLHGPMVLQALEAGKHVFVEKPLALNRSELNAIEKFYQTTPESKAPLLMTGFNRRFSPAMTQAAKIVQNRVTPFILNYRMNAGYIPLDHWVHTAEGGGRNIGEGCHIYDLFNFFADSGTEKVTAHSIVPNSEKWARNDNFTATISYADGSVCSLTYTALGAKDYPKERMEIFTEGKVITMDDYKSLEISGGRGKGWQSKTIQKGQFEELQSLAGSLLRGKPWPVSLEQQVQATEISFLVEDALND